MRRKRLKLAVVDGRTHVEVRSLLVAMRERGFLTAAQEVELAVLRQQAGQGIVQRQDGKIVLSAPGELDLAIAS